VSDDVPETFEDWFDFYCRHRRALPFPRREKAAVKASLERILGHEVDLDGRDARVFGAPLAFIPPITRDAT
jgi:hypothetical protein